MNGHNLARLLLVALAAGAGTPATAQMTLHPTADTDVNAIRDVRMNDNYGCDPILNVGTAVPSATADAVRPLIKFDLGGVSTPVGVAELSLTLSEFRNGSDPQVFVIVVHRVLEPWEEGSGNESPPHPLETCDNVDAAFGVAWIGAGDGGDANNQTQPPFDSQIWSTLTIDSAASTGPGQVYTWNVTALVNAWIVGAVPNHGFLLRDLTTDGTVKNIGFGSREQDLYPYPGLQWPAAAGPTLRLFNTVSLPQSSWGRIKAGYRTGAGV